MTSETKKSTSAPEKAETPNQVPEPGTDQAPVEKPNDKPVPNQKPDPGTDRPNEKPVPKPKAKPEPKVPSITIDATNPIAAESLSQHIRLCKMRPFKKAYIKKLEKSFVDLKVWQKANPDKVKY